MVDYKVNEEISYKHVLVIDTDGNKLGCLTLNEALKIAKAKKLDLVCVSENSNMPVCKILNYGKFKYEAIKKEKEIKKKQHVAETAEIQLKLLIQEHDLQVKVNTAKRLINRGDYVRVVLRLRGRENDMADAAVEKVNHFAELCSEFAKVKKPALKDNNDIKLILESI